MRLAANVGVLLTFAVCESIASVSTIKPQDVALPQNECSFAGVFEQSKHISGFDSPLISSGVFYYSCQGGVVWKTELPISETLVFQKHGATYTGQNNSLIELKSKPIKMLGRLLNSLIGGDREALTELFVISQAVEEPGSGKKVSHITLIPRKRNMRRAIKVIELVYLTTPGVMQKWVKISIQDRRGEWIRILSTATKSHQGIDPSIDQCTAITSLSEKVCEPLFSAPAVNPQAISQ
jgi:hypothetical protein